MNIDQGILKDTSAAELLLKGFSSELSGVLYLKREEILKELYLNKGKLVWAVSNSEVDMIENLLISEKKVDAQTISVLRGEVKDSLELGKLLVEKGLITFEELIEFSKSQLKKILLSILKWGDGVYYFSKDVPPETFMSLEIDLDKFVYNFIKQDLDMGYVWTKIGSLQEEFIKVTDDKKIEKFDLNQDELELLEKFSGDLNIEMISLNFPGMPKEDILKTIYFFMVGGLLRSKNEESFQPEPDKTSDINNLLPEEADVPVIDNSVSNIELDPVPSEENKSEDDVSFLFTNEEKEIPESISTEEPFKKPAVHSEKGRKDSMSDRLLKEMKKEEGKKRIKMINIIMLLIVVIFIIAGLIFISLSPEKDVSDTTSKGLKNKVKITDKKDITNTEQKRKIDLKDKAVVDMKKVDIQAVDKKEKDILKEKPATDISPEKAVRKKKDPVIVPVGKEEPLKIFIRGNLKKSGDLWKEEISQNNITYSILLELDCKKDSVMYAFKQIDDKKQFFILNRVRGNRTCYLVFFGKYTSKSEAEGSLNTVPRYFWKQANPPKVLELKNYL
ncbi:MAG: DUF4388 domain-containing protein [Acidobacteriota bacterium]